MPNSPDPLSQVDTVYARLLSLGMPKEISLPDFGRLYSSPTSSSKTSTRSISKSTSKPHTNPNSNGASTTRLHEAIEFISFHVVGRMESRRARGLIERIREQNAKAPRSRIKAPSRKLNDDTAHLDRLLEDPIILSTSSNESAGRALEAKSRECDVVHEEVEILDVKQKTLNRKLERSRRILFLLGVLEKREEVRERRIRGVRELVADLRKESDIAMEILRDVTLKNGTSPSLLARTGARARCLQGFNYKHTREALSRLHVRHVELASVKEGVTASATVTNTDERLDAALRRLGIDCNGSEDIKLKLIALARKRTTAANRKTSRRARLTAVAESNEEKEREIQSKISRVVGLGYLSERHIEVLTNSESLSSSRSMVEQECKRVKGYIDVLRLGILQEREAKKQIYKPGNASTEHQVIQCETRLRDLKAVSRRVQEGDDAVDPEMRLMNGDNVKLAEALLRRKGDKALHGFKIAKEIETLLKEARQIK